MIAKLRKLKLHCAGNFITKVQIKFITKSKEIPHTKRTELAKSE